VLDTLQVLREYLGTIRPQTAGINLWLPDGFGEVHTLLNAYGITTSSIRAAIPSEEIAKAFGENAPPDMRHAAATALSCDADLVVTERSDWFPFYQEFEDLNILLGSAEIALRQCEIFVRGHDVPWSFDSPMLDVPWGLFYLFAEHRALSPGLAFMDACQRKGIHASVQEVGRSLVYNRIPNIMFTRDRLLFYEMQQAAAKRAKWQRQKFQFEIGYHLNFYYLLLYGGFDHLAVLVNEALGLGLAVWEVAATGKEFLKGLSQKAPEVYAIFSDPTVEDFIARIASLRHSSAHRGQVMPAPVYQEPDHEPTVAELDEEIRAKGLDRDFEFFPAGPVQEAFRESVRFKLRLSKYKLIFEDAVFSDSKKNKGFIKPLLDTEWNFNRFYEFADSVLNACTKRLQ